MSDTVLTCVYCGHQYPDGTPAAKHQLLTEHIAVCDMHPLREAELKIKKLRTTPAPDSDKIAAIVDGYRPRLT